MSLLRLFTSPRFAPLRRALATLFLFVAPEACGDSNPYVDAPGTGGDQGQLDIAVSNAGRPVALGGAVVIAVSKHEQWEHEVCNEAGCGWGGVSCDSGWRPIPIVAETACDAADCTIESSTDNEFIVHPLRDGTLVLHLHAHAMDRDASWDDTLSIDVARAHGIAVTHDPLADPGGVVHAGLVGSTFSWCGLLYRQRDGKREALYSATPLVSFDLPSSLVPASPPVPLGYGGVQSGTYLSWDSSRTCVTFHATAVGTTAIVAHAPSTPDRVIPLRIADRSEISAAELRTVAPELDVRGPYAADDATPDVGRDPLQGDALSSITLEHGATRRMFGVVLVLNDGSTALGGAKNLAVDEPWIVDHEPLGSGDDNSFVALAACSRGEWLGTDDAGAKVATDASPSSDAGPGSPDAGADAAPPPTGYTVYDCTAGTTHLRGDLWGAALDVPVIVPAF